LETNENIDAFLRALEDYVPTIPDEVTSHFLESTGFQCPDLVTKRVVALAAQKFISEIANDAMQYCKIRQQNPNSREKTRTKEKRLVLKMEDLVTSLKDSGIVIKKPDYYADHPMSGLATSSKDKAKEKAPTITSSVVPPTATTSKSGQQASPAPTTAKAAKETGVREKTKTAAKAKTAVKTGKGAKTKGKKALAAAAAVAALNDPSFLD